MDHLLKTKKECSNSEKQEIQDTFIKTNRINPAFDKILLMKVLNLSIYLEKQLLIKYSVIKHLILLKLHNMTEVNVDLIQWFIFLLIKNLLVASLHMHSQSEIYLLLKVKLCQTSK